MLGLCIVTALVLQHVTAEGERCPPLPINHLQWLNPDGSLVRPQALYYDKTLNRDVGTDDCCGPLCNHKWKLIPESPSCKFCPSTETVLCQDTDIYNVPVPEKLPSANLFLFKISGAGLISLPPKSFHGLSIQNLVIDNSNLSYLTIDTFIGVKKIASLYLKNNNLDYIPQADYLFQHINGLKFLRLEDDRLKVLSSANSANMQNLTYFSLAGNTLYSMEIFFLQNSGLTFLDLRNITFKLKNINIEGSGLSKLPSNLSTVDLSRATITYRALGKIMEQLKGKNITTLNLSYLQSQIWSFLALKHLKYTLQYLSLKGTDLYKVFNSKRINIKNYKHVKLEILKELNLENCNILYLESEVISHMFPYLTVLSVAGNLFTTLDVTFLHYLPKLVYLNLSENIIMDVVCEYYQAEGAKNLQEADLSNTNIDLSKEKSEIFFSTFKNLKMLSLCKSILTDETASALHNLSNLKYLDLSAVFSFPELGPVFYDLFSKNNKSLTEIHFAHNNLKNDSPFYFSQFTSLEILDISNNLIREISVDMLAPTLKTLNASQNLITTWYFPNFNNTQLQYLDISNNQITYVSDAMIEDFYKLDFLGLANNPLICHNKVVALVCSNIKNNTENLNNKTQSKKPNAQGMRHHSDHPSNNSHTLVFTDWKEYKCYDLLFNGFRNFSQEKDCIDYYEEVSTTTTAQYYQETTKAIQPSVRKLAWNSEWNYLIVSSIVVVIALGSIVYLKWWTIRSFFHSYISLKKARLLQKKGSLSSKPEVYYDVFVSYSDVDRLWILDHLVPNMERDGDVSLCFHERDFQVGMSILENIIDCMDRSHALLLVVSSAFIYSKWCQFEMHLAQNRLIETLKDQLVLILLEDIPRKWRPQTLQHLMKSKTYLMWPQQPCNDDAYELFWRRLKRALRPNSHFLA